MHFNRLLCGSGHFRTKRLILQLVSMHLATKAALPERLRLDLTYRLLAAVELGSDHV
jgi:hypothetical protein